MRYIFPLLLLLLAPFAIAQDVDVGVYVLNIGKFDISTGSYTVDFYLSLKCSVDCSKVDYEFINGRADKFDTIIDTKEEKFYRVLANLNTQIDLKQYPLDSQKIVLQIEDKKLTTDELRFIPNLEESGIDNSIAFSGWDVKGWSAQVSEHEYPVYDETYSQYNFTIDISRIFLNSFIKTFLPVLFIILVLLFSFILDPDKVTTRLGMAGSTLVASVMFHVSITNQIPPVGYLTFADKFMLITYMVVLTTFFINVLLVHYQETKNKRLVQELHTRTEYSMLIFVPLAYLIFFLLFI
jgi:hypothetical protein